MNFSASSTILHIWFSNKLRISLIFSDPVFFLRLLFCYFFQWESVWFRYSTVRWLSTVLSNSFQQAGVRSTTKIREKRWESSDQLPSFSSQFSVGWVSVTCRFWRKMNLKWRWSCSDTSQHLSCLNPFYQHQFEVPLQLLYVSTPTARHTHL